MEPEIINNTQITKPLIDTLCLPVVKKLQNRILLVLLAGYPVIILLYCHILDWQLNRFSPFTLLVLVACTGFLAWRYFTFGHKTAELTEIQLREISDGKLPLLQYRFYPDHIEIFNHATGGTKSILYAEIKTLYITKDTYIMHSTKGFSPIDKSGFEKGDAASFEALMRQCTPGIKVKKLDRKRKDN